MKLKRNMFNLHLIFSTAIRSRVTNLLSWASWADQLSSAQVFRMDSQLSSGLSEGHSAQLSSVQYLCSQLWRFATVSDVWNPPDKPTLVSFSPRVHRQNLLLPQKQNYREQRIEKMTIITAPAPIEIVEETVEFTSELFDCNQEEHSPAKVFCCPCLTFYLLERKISSNFEGTSRDF